MGRIGHGYGSEFHLLQYLEHRPEELNRVILSHFPKGNAIEWIPNPETSKKPGRKQAEWKGLDFLPAFPEVLAAWKKFWPQTGEVQNWDAVGWLADGQHKELLLVEAKANLEEIQSACGASPKGGLPQIEKAFIDTKKALGIPLEKDWLKPFYQSANRVTVLHFLRQHQIKAHLIGIYFMGDRVPARTCPQTVEEWQTALIAQDMHLGLDADHPLSNRIHKVFLGVSKS